MKYHYLLPPLLLAGILVIGVEPTDEPENPSRDESRPDNEAQRALSVQFPPILEKLGLTERQREQIRELIVQSAARRRRGKDRDGRREIQRQHDLAVLRVLTEAQQIELQKLRTPRLDNDRTQRPRRNSRGNSGDQGGSPTDRSRPE